MRDRKRTYAVRWSYSREVADHDRYQGNGVWALRLRGEGVLEVRAENKPDAEREGLYFLKKEFKHTAELKVIEVVRQ